MVLPGEWLPQGAGWGALCVLGALWVQGALARGLASPLKVAQCRAMCMRTFPGEDAVGNRCLQNINCNTCWEQCQRLGAGWSSICDQDTACEAGCQQACRFHLQLEVQRSPVLVTRGEEVILRSGQTASWPPPTSPESPHVFVLMCRLPNDTWTQVVQTLELSWDIPRALGCRTERVMVVGEAGLVTVYSPAPKPLQDADLILRSVGRGNLWRNLATSQDDLLVREQNHPLTKDGREVPGWNLRQVSLMHQGVLVIAEIAWEPQVPTSVYLVTWELAGGGLKGSLLTDSTCVTLSLWPDTVYRIQVQLAREPRKLSEALVLDTRQAAPLVHSQPASHPVHGHPGFEGVAGAAAAVLLFLAVVLLLSGRGRDNVPDKSREVMHLHASDHFRLFPPPVTLLLEPSTLPADSPVASAGVLETSSSSGPSPDPALVV